jgi:hypothetical protein
MQGANQNVTRLSATVLELQAPLADERLIAHQMHTL